jgi:hypothetical protein
VPGEVLVAEGEDLHREGGVSKLAAGTGDHRFFAALALLKSLRKPADCFIPFTY